MSKDNDDGFGTPKPKSGRRSGKGNRSNVKWVDSQPNSEDRIWLADNTEKLLTLFFELVDDMEEDQRLTLKFDDYSHRWVAMYFAGGGSGSNAGMALSVRGSTPYHAAVLLAYVHIIKFSRVWADVSTEDDSEWG